MARFLALDWDQKYVRVVEATVGGGSVRIQRAAVWPVEQAPAASVAEEQGRWLKERLKEAGIAAAPLIVALGRDRVILKDIRYPEVAETEEPAVIRFQAARELTDAPEELIIDYCPMGDAGGNGQKRALVVIGRRDLIGAYHTIAKTAGLKLTAITPRSFGLVACLNRLAGTSVLTPAYAAGDAAAVVSLSETWAEFCIIQQEKLVYSRFLPASDTLAGEIRRNLLVYAGQAPQHPLRSVYVAGDQAELMAQLQTTPSIAFHRLDPFGGEERPGLPNQGRGAFAGVIGLLHAQAGKAALSVNLIQPHQYQSSKATPKRRLAFAGALAAALFLSGIGICSMILSRANAEVEEQADANAELDSQLTRLDGDEKRIKELAEWENGNIVWVDELVEVTNRFGDTKTTQVTHLNADHFDNKNAKAKFPAKLVIKGLTKDGNRAIDDLMARLVGNGRYHVESKTFVPNDGPDKVEFPQQFTFPEIDVEKTSEKKAVPSKTSASSDTKINRN